MRWRHGGAGRAIVGLGLVAALAVSAAPARAHSGGCPQAERVRVPGAEQQLVTCLDDLTTPGLLAAGPTLLLLDEPTAGMAPAETDRTMQLVRRIAAERSLTVLFCEHDMDVVFGTADRILVMHAGRPLADGTPDEVRADPEVRRVYLGEEED